MIKSASTLAPAENQKEYRQNQIIKFNIPSFYGFVDGRQSFLRANIRLQSGVKAALSRKLGAQALISAVRIYDHSNAQLLENIENYGEIVQVLNVYGENETIRHQRQLLEAVDVLDEEGGLNRETALFFNAYGDNSTNTEDLVESGEVNENVVQIAMRLHSGILGSDRVFPIVAFGGLRVEIELNSAAKAMMVLDAGLFEENGFSVQEELVAGVHSECAIDVSLTQCPYVVGQYITLKDNSGNTYTTYITEVSPSQGVEDGTTLKFGQIDLVEPLSPGEPNRVYMSAEQAEEATRLSNFRLTEVELCLKQVSPPASYVQDLAKQMGSDEGFDIDIRTWDLIRNNILNGQSIDEQPIHSYSMRVFSVLSLLTKNGSDSIFTDSFRTESSGLKKYAYAIDGKKNPNRDVETGLTTLSLYHINQQSTFELKKALESCGLVVRDLPLKENFLVARAFGRYGGVSNLQEKNLTLRLEFDVESLSMLCLNFICSLRRLNVSSRGITVIA